MKSTHLSKKAKHNNASIDLPSHRVWVRLEEYGLKAPNNLKTGLDLKQIEKAEDIMDKAYDSILKKLVRQN